LTDASSGFGMVALSGLLGTGVFESEGVAGPTLAGSSNPLAAKATSFPAKAKSVIFLFMSGGVSAVDTFDPKPRLTRDNGKPMPVPVRPTMFNSNGNILASPWKFSRYGQSGLPVSELFPNVAKSADDLAVIRSMTSIANEHAQANYFIHTGFSLAGHPSAGAWMVYGLGNESQELPGFVVLASGGSPLGGISNYGSGYLPSVYHASMIDPTKPEPLANIVPHVPDQRQRLSLEFIERLDRQHLKTLRGAEQVESAIQNYETAYRMQSAVPDLVDIRDETKGTQSLYGMDSSNAATREYGRQCLLARRLVERGVRFVELTCLPNANGSIPGNPWDQHGGLKAGHEEMARQVDQPIAGLIRDLKQRGLLDETLIVWAGEFGRTPFAQGSDGRDHNPFGFTVWLAGGGVRGGVTYGATDDLGYHAVENRSTIYDLWATVLHQLGVDHQSLTYRHGGRDFRLTDVHGNVLHEILGSWVR
jgi:hypothetical protein